MPLVVSKAVNLVVYSVAQKVDMRVDNSVVLKADLMVVRWAFWSAEHLVEHLAVGLVAKKAVNLVAHLVDLSDLKQVVCLVCKQVACKADHSVATKDGVLASQ